MKREYACPHCKATLNPGTKIILAARRGRHRGLILLSPQIGNYKTIIDPGFPLRRGDMVEFACPACATPLTSATERHLAEINLRQSGRRPLVVVFSRVYGKHATFLCDGENVTEYGEDTSHYEKVNFFGA